VSIVITGNEINEYFKVLLKAMSLVFPELASKTKHISHGMLRLPEGKMSSRTGNIITAESLITKVTETVMEKMKDSEIDSGEKEKIAETVALGAIKYTILRSGIGGDIIFDFDKSISFEGDSGPYLQYATVRAHSILKKAHSIVAVSKVMPENWETTNLERMLERFPSVVERAGVEYAPHYITTYLTELAGEFNSFYASSKIIDETDVSSPYRLALTEAFVQVMTNGLNLLGINIPERM
jgi:arginyl-tRNA synthetase